MSSPAPGKRRELKVAVIGGGIGGCVATDTILRGGDNAVSVTLFEASHRLGGRCRSVGIPVPEGEQVAGYHGSAAREVEHFEGGAAVVVARHGATLASPRQVS